MQEIIELEARINRMREIITIKTFVLENERSRISDFEYKKHQNNLTIMNDQLKLLESKLKGMITNEVGYDDKGLWISPFQQSIISAEKEFKKFEAFMKKKEQNSNKDGNNE